MLNLTRKTDYALVALAHLTDRAATRSSPASARDIAQSYGLPLALTMNVLKRLHLAGIIGSTRGARGGYYLANEPANIRLTDVIAAIEGPVKVAICCHEHTDDTCPSCGVVARCPITASVRQLNEQILDFLDQFTLASLMSGIPGPLELGVELTGVIAAAAADRDSSTQAESADAGRTR